MGMYCACLRVDYPSKHQLDAHGQEKCGETQRHLEKNNEARDEGQES